jgi:peroxiredoxin family protein
LTADVVTLNKSWSEEDLSKPLFLLLCSGEHEKIQMAAMMASVAAVSERPVQLFVSMNALLSFKKEVTQDGRYQGGTFSKLMRDKKAPDAMQLFGQGKALGSLSIYACSMALDISGLELADLVDDLFDGVLGLTKFLSDAESGDLVVL